MKVMISQPMAGRTVGEIEEVRNKAIAHLENLGYEVVDSFFKESYDSTVDLRNKGYLNIPLYHLGKSLFEMSRCDAVYFVKGWERARGCGLEREVAKSYNVKIIDEEEEI